MKGESMKKMNVLVERYRLTFEGGRLAELKAACGLDALMAAYDKGQCPGEVKKLERFDEEKGEWTGIAVLGYLKDMLADMLGMVKTINLTAYRK